MPTKRIIVIDDEEPMQELLEEILGSKGYEVEATSSGEEGLRKLSENFYHLAIVDVRLQDMNGIDVMERLEKISPYTEIIVMTAYASVDTAIRAMRSRAYDYISKPFKMDQLVGAVEGALRLQKLRMENKTMLEQLTFLNEVSSEISKTLKLDDILDLVLTRVLDFYDVKAGAVYVKGDYGWALRRSVGVSQRFMKEFSTLDEKHPMVQQATGTKLAVLGKSNINATGATWASVPFLFGDKIMGILVLAGKGSELLDEEDRRFLTILGAQVGTILNNVTTFERIERTRNYLQNLLDNTADAIITFDLQGNVLGWNPAASDIFGYSAEEALGKRILTVPTDLRGEMMAMMEEVKRGGTISNYETIRQTKQGELVEVAITYSPIKDPSGRLVGISCIVRDLTNKKQAEHERIKSQILEAQGKIRDVLIDVVPLLLKRRLPVEDRNEFILTLSRKLEEALYDEYVPEGVTDPAVIAESIAMVFNDMGGDFGFEMNGDQIQIIGRKCPWHNEVRRNPVICMLTKSVCARFAKRAFGEVLVSLDMTLANRDDRCQVTITRQ